MDTTIPSIWSKASFQDSHVINSMYFLIISVLLIASLLTQHWFKQIKKASIPEAIFPILIGLFVSVVIKLVGATEIIQKIVLDLMLVL